MIVSRAMKLFLFTAFMVLSPFLVRSQASTSSSTIDLACRDFVQRYWKGSNWKGASSWTGDNASRLMINYLDVMGSNKSQAECDDVLGKVVSRSLNTWTLLQYLTQGYDDFGWTTFIILEIIRYLDQHEKRFPSSSITPRHPNLRERLAFRAAFLHDAVKDSWSADLCGGGAEWKVRVWRLNVWPSLTLSRVYKNSITNHLYNANNAQMFNLSSSRPRPYDFTEVSLQCFRLVWKLFRPVFGWSKSHARLADFDDPDFIRRASEGLRWMERSHLRTNDSLYMDGKRPRFVQASPDERLRALCDATVRTLFTYNQLAGIRALRFLARANGDLSILGQGHGMIRNVITSTYNGRLGWNGVIHDHCDRFGNCTQDMQIFKGLPFLDIKDFCESLDYLGPDVQDSHRKNCSSYRLWIRRNAAAAYGTVDQLGDFGSYWGSDPLNRVTQVRSIETQVAGLSVMLVSAWFENNF